MTELPTPAIEVIHQGHRTTIWLNRPERHNAFDANVIAELASAFEAAGRQPHTRVVVLAARGGTFCAGAATCAGCARWPTKAGTTTWPTHANWPS